MSALAVRAQGIRVSLGGVAVLHGIDLELRRGCWCSVVGPNGAGKSTLLKALAGLLPHTGQVWLGGHNSARMPRRARAQALAWLGQHETSANDLPVQDVVMLGRLPHQAWLAGASAQDWQAVEVSLRQTQAWEWRHRLLGQLSAGERQRVLLARALAVQAQVLLLDEPLANLDPPHQADWVQLVRQLVAQGKTVLSVLHEIAVALYADELLILRQGQVWHHGASVDPTTQSRLEQVFDNRVGVHRLFHQPVVLLRRQGEGDLSR